MTTTLLLIHGLLAAALIGAITHQSLSLWWPPRAARGSFLARFRGVNVAGFGKEVDPKDVEVSCDKPGYKQLRVVRRSSPSTDPKIPVETECTLQRI